jgi:signal transduction histidine kinase
MRESLRARLLLWYAAMLGAVMVSFGAAVCYFAWRARVADLDAALHARAGALAAALEPVAGGAFDLVLPPAGPAAEAPYHLIWTGTGGVIDRSDSAPDVLPPAAPGARTRDGRREVALRASSGAWVLAGRPLAPMRAEIWSLAGTIAGVGASALALSLALGWWWVGRALAPVERINRTARAMISGDFAARVPVDRVETELGQMASALNEAFDRLHESLDRQRRFTADASHELRTPLATVLTETEWALGRERRPDEYRHSLEACRRAADRMQGVVSRLLALARSEAGAAADRAVAVQLDAVVREAAGEVTALAARQQVTVALDVAPAVVTGDPDRLREAVTNVLVNAVRYNVPGGRVDLSLVRQAGEVQLTVTDTGQGIADADLPRIFDPFFRADPARSHDAGGAGLGLTVTRAVLARHGGRIHCESRPGRGTTMRMHLPCRMTPTGVVS